MDTTGRETAPEGMGLPVRPLNLFQGKEGLGQAQKEVLRCFVDEALVTALSALSDRAKEGNVQAIKLLIDYARELKGGDETLDFGDLTEVERKCLKEALIREIISLRGHPGGTGGLG